ncbi:MAG: thiol reductase thioredoxin [Phycisphaerales bacterium]|nr:thiol reductase thioredoxin [Phycisphaerales bacterium]
MFDRALLETSFAQARPFPQYIDADAARAPHWWQVHARSQLTSAQSALLASFTRKVNVLCLSGTWCGDCAQQVPLLHRIAEGSPHIDLRCIDRTEAAALSDQVTICGGARVPVVIFMSEDFAPCGVLGDCTLTRYRAIASRKLDGACELPWAKNSDEEMHATLADWLGEFERVQWMLRLSPRLRALHGD